jgi:hypothetical protein
MGQGEGKRMEMRGEERRREGGDRVKVEMGIRKKRGKEEKGEKVKKENNREMIVLLRMVEMERVEMERAKR